MNPQIHCWSSSCDTRRHYTDRVHSQSRLPTCEGPLFSSCQNPDPLSTGNLPFAALDCGRSTAAWPGPSLLQSPPMTPHHERCLNGKDDFARSSEFLGKRAFATRIAIAAVTVRGRQQCGRGGASRPQIPHASSDCVLHPPHPPRGHQLDYPHYLPLLLAIGPASPNCLTRDAWCRSLLDVFWIFLVCSGSSNSNRGSGGGQVDC